MAMRRRKHAARGRGLTRLTVLLAVTSLLVLMLAGAAFAGYRYEQARTARILPGVRIAGVEVGGLTRAEAELALAGAASSILSRPIDVSAAGKTWHLTARELGVHVDVKPVVGQALGLSGSLSWTNRLYHRLLNKPLSRSFDLPVSYDDRPVTSFVKAVAGEIRQEPVDAFLDFAGGHLVVRHAKAGRALRVAASGEALRAALHGGAFSADLEMRRLAPSVADSKLGKTIIIRISENRLYLYDGLKLRKTFGVATGQLGRYPTPMGHWKIMNKRVNPTWVNPAKDTWGKDEPDFIPPGPDNPLGTRALDLDAPGIRIHGTPADYSIGHYASHGCIRMHIPDSEQLFGLVGVGTPVIIVW
jgi:L,D-transpeptidase-like protein/putative peptidoglycan binding protein